MAWISVHEQVIGGKLRNLAKEIGCSQNEALGILIRLWLWAINNAGKDGNIVGADKDDVAEILNIGLDRRYSADGVVDALIATNWIDMENGLYIHDWEEWQEQWYKAIEARERDAARKRKERNRKRMDRLPAAQGDLPEGQAAGETMDNGLLRISANQFSQLEAAGEAMEQDLPVPYLHIPQGETQKQKPADGYPKDFEGFWEEYPRKIGKGEAYKKYKARLNDGWSEAELLEAARNYAGRVAMERTEQRYIKHAKTFLSESTPFVDFLPKGMDAKQQKSPDDGDEPYAEWRD